MTDKLPIDIQYIKLVDWLSSRNKLKGKWQSSLISLRERVSIAAAKIPEDLEEIQVLLAEPDTHYYHCKEILRLLEHRLGDKAKNFLGMYKDDQLKEWSSIVSTFEKNNLYLADASRILERNAAYEIPALKNNIQKNEKEVTDIGKKIAANERTKEDWKAKFESSCVSLGIKGDNLRIELKQLTSQLPKVFQDVFDFIQSEDLTTAIQFYNEFSEYLQTLGDTEIQVEKHVQFLSKCRKMKRLKSNIADIPETSKETGAVNWDITAEGGDVDWGITAEGAGNSDVNWDIETTDAPAETAEISWDIETTDAPAETAEISWDIETTDAPAETAEISWDIETTDAPAETAEISWDIETTDAPSDKIAEATNNDDCEVLDMLNTEVRINLLNDLMEIEGFLEGRAMEMKNIESEGAAMWFRMDDAPEIVKNQTLDSVLKLCEHVSECIAKLSADKLHELVLIQQGGKLLDRMVETLEKKKSMSSKLDAQISRLDVKRSQLLQSSGNLGSKLKNYVDSTKSLKSELEKSLSSMFDGRVVNLVGDINFI